MLCVARVPAASLRSQHLLALTASILTTTIVGAEGYPLIPLNRAGRLFSYGPSLGTTSEPRLLDIHCSQTAAFEVSFRGFFVSSFCQRLLLRWPIC